MVFSPCNDDNELNFHASSKEGCVSSNCVKSACLSNSCCEIKSLTFGSTGLPEQIFFNNKSRKQIADLNSADLSQNMLIFILEQNRIICSKPPFLAVQDSSIGDLVTD